MNTLTKFASFVLSAAFLAASMNLCAAEKTIKLPPPDKAGGKPLMQCLTERKSERKFDSKPLPPQILSDLLYAADGISRPDGRKTVPTARNLQSQEVYAAMADGLYLYHPKTHSLDLVKAGDIREKCGMQAIHKTAPIVLIYVGDVSKIGKNAAEKVFYAANHAGYASQNVYLYCTSAGLATVVCGLVNKLPGGERRAQADADMEEMVHEISGGVKGAGMNAALAVLGVADSSKS